jgi:ELWxxDGT repeat protein
VYFFANTSTYGNELWRSDGTDTGTSLFKDIKPGTGSSFTSVFPSFMVFKNKLYFGANDNDSTGVELWSTDGSKTNTKLVLNINTKSGGGSFPGLLLANENFMFFRANNGNDGIEPWITDGTVSGTKQLIDIYPGLNSSIPSSAIAINNKFIFNASSPNEGSEAYVTDGTIAGTIILKDILPGTGSSYPLSKVLHNNKVYFYAVDSIYGTEIWQTDGTNNGTSIALDINPGKKGSSIISLFSFNNEMYFGATVDKDSLGQELYKYNFKTNINHIQLSKIKLFPNPVKLGNDIQIDGLNTPLNRILLIDWLGRTIVTANTLEDYNRMFRNSQITPGIYNIHLSCDEIEYDVKVVIE